ncbi:MAG: 6-phosphogluconolactonase [Xanthomonadaceae bacterium]|nr:6-phosphogluconolactonase [Xanthomonadaceae bacterium]
MGWIEHDYPDTQALIASVSTSLEAVCRAALSARSHAFLSLAGGRTPLPVYAHLAGALLGGRIDVVPTDERCVPHDHPACNLRNLRAAFALDARFDVSPLTTAEGDGEGSLALARTWLAAHPQPFDAVLLGMGADGHFASLFPGAANVQDGLAPDSGVDAIATLPDPLPPEAPFPRISLTLPRLLHAQEVHLVVTGHDKRRVLRQAQQDPQSPHPVAALLQAAQAHPIHIHWSP